MIAGLPDIHWLADGELGPEMLNVGAKARLWQDNRIGSRGHDRIEIGVDETAIQGVDPYKEPWPRRKRPCPFEEVTGPQPGRRTGPPA